MKTTGFHKLCDEFEAAWEVFKQSSLDRLVDTIPMPEQGLGNGPQIDGFLDRAADSERSELLRELIQIEIWWRCDESPPPDKADYQSRFPDQHSIVDEAYKRFRQRSSVALDANVSSDEDDREKAKKKEIEDVLERFPQSLAPETQDLRQTLAETSLKPATVKPATARKTFGRYRLLKELGRGGMGVVYLAHDEQLDRKVALKIPTFRESVRDEMLTRFYREARAAAALRDPGICPVYDVGEIDGQTFIAMAFIEGRPLRDYTQRKKPHDAKKTIRVIRKLAQAMSEAHEAGIVHRDLKPANIMMEKGHSPVIMDFGLAYSTTEMESRLTGTGAILGTPTYMSPEQAMGDTKNIGPATDIYSLGMICYEMLAGCVPFEGNVTAVLTKIVTQEPKPLSEHVLSVDAKLPAIVSRMMAKQASDRYESMSAVVTALTEYLQEGSSESDGLEAGPAGTDEKPQSSAAVRNLFIARNKFEQSNVGREYDGQC